MTSSSPTATADQESSILHWDFDTTSFVFLTVVSLMTLLLMKTFLVLFAMYVGIYLFRLRSTDQSVVGFFSPTNNLCQFDKWLEATNCPFHLLFYCWRSTQSLNFCPFVDDRMRVKVAILYISCICSVLCMYSLV